MPMQNQLLTVQNVTSFGHRWAYLGMAWSHFWSQNDSVREAEIGSPFPAAIQNQQLMPEQHRLRDYGTQPTWLGQPEHRHE